MMIHPNHALGEESNFENSQFVSILIAVSAYKTLFTNSEDNFCILIV